MTQKTVRPKSSVAKTVSSWLGPWMDIESNIADTLGPKAWADRLTGKKGARRKTVAAKK